MISCDDCEHTCSIALNKENNPKIQSKHSFFSETDLGHNILKKSFLYFYKIWKILHLQNENNLVIKKRKVLRYKNYFLTFHNKCKDLKKIKNLKTHAITHMYSQPSLRIACFQSIYFPGPCPFLQFNYLVTILNCDSQTLNIEVTGSRPYI